MRASGDRLRLSLVLVDAAEDERRAVLPRDRDDPFELLRSVFVVDRVDDRLALAVRESLLHRRGVGAVDDERHLHHPDDLLVEALDVLRLVAVGVLEVDVDELRAGLDLRAADLGRLLELLFLDEPLELAAADLVGPLADDERPGRLLALDVVDARDVRPHRGGRTARLPSLRGLRDLADVLRRRSAAAADDVDPALLDEAGERAGDHRGRLAVLPVLVGQAGVRVAADRARREAVQGAQVVGHEFRAGRAVEADRGHLRVLDRRVERVDGLSGEHRPHRFDRRGDHERDAQAGLQEGLADRDDPRLHVARVLRRFEEEQVGAALQQPDRLRPVGGDQLVEGDAAGDGDGLRRRPHRPRDEPRAGELRRRFAGDPCGRLVEFDRAVLQAVLGEHGRHSPERVRRDDVGLRGEVGLVDAADDVGPGDDEVLVAALEIGPAEILRGEVRLLEHRPHRAVDDEDPLRQELEELLSARRVTGEWMLHRFEVAHILLDRLPKTTIGPPLGGRRIPPRARPERPRTR